MKFYLSLFVALSVSSSLAYAQQVDTTSVAALSGNTIEENKEALSEAGSSALESSMYNAEKNKWSFKLTQETMFQANTVNYGDYKGTGGVGYVSAKYKFEDGGSLEARQYIASRYSEVDIAGKTLEAGAKPTDLALVYFKANATEVFGHNMHFMARQYMPIGDIEYKDKNWQSRLYFIFPVFDSGKWKLSYALVSRYYIYESSKADDRTRFANEVTGEYVVNDDLFLYSRLYQNFYYKRGLDEKPQLLNEIDMGVEWTVGNFTFNPYVKQSYDMDSEKSFRFLQVDKEPGRSNISYNLYLKMKI